MLKMIIADDEKVIREAINTLIDWSHYGIEIIGLCKNGLEAFDMIVDESPDIVMTDIKMPGLNGLELIKKTIYSKLNTQFILLSGYGEFEYAQEAMKYGIRHYLLKPCDEEQILECIQEITQDCFKYLSQANLEEKEFNLTRQMHHQIMSAIINESLGNHPPYDTLFKNYEPFLDFHFTPYRLFYIYFLEQESLFEYLEKLMCFCQEEYPQVIVHGVYVKNTLALFCRNMVSDYDKLFSFLTSSFVLEDSITLQAETCVYDRLSELLSILLDKAKRFSTIFYINHFHAIPTVNYSYMLDSAVQLYMEVKKGKEDIYNELTELLENIDNITLFKQLSVSLLLKEAGQSNCISPVRLTEWLLDIDNTNDIRLLKSTMALQLKKLLLPEISPAVYSSITEQVLAYVDTHLNESGLTLKSIAEKQLFMNVDYVNKRFVRETGQKFSNYLTTIRVEKAKEYMAAGEKIQDVAEFIGCGNHPHYFSQLFKKKTGMTPTAYLKMIS